MSHRPIEPQHFTEMNRVAEAIDAIFDGYGFCLLVFDKDTTDGRMNYICNCNRADMICAMKELIANFEGRAIDPPSDLPPQ